MDAAGLIWEVLPSKGYISGPHSPRLPDFLSQKEVQLRNREQVFVSYAWSPESTAIVDKLQEAFKGREIILSRDKNDVHYKDSIRDFMGKIGRGKCIVVVLSKRYLESENCMFELTEIAGEGNVRDRVFPIILDDAKIYDGLGRIRYIHYWEQKKKELDTAMKQVSGEDLQGIREELDLFAKIRSTIAQIVDILGDMNALTPDQHLGSNFDLLFKALEAKLSE